MEAAVASSPMAPEAYLELERQSEGLGVKHEYVDGFVYAMAGASRRHAAIVREITVALSPIAKHQGCDLYSNDVKVHIAEANCYYYPDIVISCDPTDSDPYVIECPAVVVEVLSPSTASTDRREKLINYRKVPSLTDILLVDPEARTITHHRRSGQLSKDWLVETADATGHVSLVWAEMSLSAAAVFA